MGGYLPWGTPHCPDLAGGGTYLGVLPRPDPAGGGVPTLDRGLPTLDGGYLPWTGGYLPWTGGTYFEVPPPPMVDRLKT